MFRTILSAALLVVCLAEKIQYDGYQVLRITPTNENEVNALRNLQESELGEKLDFWVGPTTENHPVDILVSPTLRGDVTRTLSRRGMKFSVWIEDIQERIDTERDDVNRNSWSLTNYNTYDEIQQWIDDMATKYPFASKESLGASFEGRDIGVLRLNKGGSNDNPNNAFVFHGGIHAREWISPAACIYMIDMLLNDPDTSYLDDLDIYFIPSLNADGYYHTWTRVFRDVMSILGHQGTHEDNIEILVMNPICNPLDRMWRKNRNTNGGGCTGVDLNRNWPKGFGGSGSSGSKCSETYRGPSPISEPESIALDNLLKSLGSRLKGYIDFHAYSQMWMTPWGYTYSLPSDYYGTQYPVAEDCANAIKAMYGTPYTYGSTSNVVWNNNLSIGGSAVSEEGYFYQTPLAYSNLASTLSRDGALPKPCGCELYGQDIASGVTQDYTYASEYLNVLHSYGVELRDKGRYGFLLPESQIEPSGIETYEALKVVMSAVMKA